MIETASGIILRTRPLTETSLIVHWLTAEAGRLSTVAKGARRPKSPFAGKLDLFYAAKFSFVRSRHSDLHTLREVNLLETHAVLRRDLSRLQQAAYAAALIEQTTETDTPLTDLHRFLAGFLAWLCVHPPLMQNVIALELKLLRALGMEPDVNETKLSSGSQKMAAALLAADWSATARLRPSTAQGEELQRWLQHFMLFHLGRYPRSRPSALSAG